MTTTTKKRLVLAIAWGIILLETVLISIHHHAVGEFLIHYGWVAPLVLFKSLIKQFLLLNVFGLLKVLWGLAWHLIKLLVVKLLKTFGVRYGTYFSSRRWQKLAQRLRILGKRLSRRQRGIQFFLTTFKKREYAVIIVAFFPLFVLLFLLGFASRITREAMVKKGSELGVTKVALSTANKSKGLIARIKQLDAWILRQIEKLTL